MRAIQGTWELRETGGYELSSAVPPATSPTPAVPPQRKADRGAEAARVLVGSRWLRSGDRWTGGERSRGQWPPCGPLCIWKDHSGHQVKNWYWGSI